MESKHVFLRYMHMNLPCVVELDISFEKASHNLQMLAALSYPVNTGAPTRPEAMRGDYIQSLAV